jgi:purine-binding chemotaxis protein CheW
VLVVRAGERLCALPVSAVGETMRPLPVAPIAGAPPYVLGVAIVRGEPVPVVDLAALVGGGATAGAATRFVSVRSGGRVAALAVAEVLGVTSLGPEGARNAPLLADACGGTLVALRARDEDLLLVLGAGRLVPPEATAAAARGEAPR